MGVRMVITVCPPWRGASERDSFDCLYSQLLLGDGSVGKGNPLEAGSYLNGQEGREEDQNGESHREGKDVREGVRKKGKPMSCKGEGKECLEEGRC